MLDKMLDTYNKAIESTLKLQEEMLGKLTDQWSSFPPPPPEPKSAGAPSSNATEPSAPVAESLALAQKKLAEMVTDMLNRHRESLDEHYKTGIRILDDLFKTGELHDPEQLRHFSEALWTRSLKTMETAAGSHLHDLQAVLEKWFQAASAGVKGTFEQMRRNS